MKYRFPITLFIVFSILFLATSCHRTARVLKPDQMTDVLFDIHLAQGIFKFDQKNYRSYTAKDSLINSVLLKHHISQADLDTSLVYYSDHIQDYNKINDLLKKRLKNSLDIYSSQKKMIDQNRMLPSVLPKRIWLGKNSMNYVFAFDSFKIKKDSLSHFKLKFDVFGKNDSLSAVASVYYTYKDTVVKRMVHIRHNKAYEIDYPHIHDTIVKNIAGYFKLEKNSSRFYTPGFLIYNISYKDSVVKPTEPKQAAAKKSVAVSKNKK